jgi:hypothetical protein
VWKIGSEVRDGSVAFGVVCVFGGRFLFFRFDNAALLLQNHRDVRIESSVKTCSGWKKEHVLRQTLLRMEPKPPMQKKLPAPAPIPCPLKTWGLRASSDRQNARTDF